MDPNIPEEPPSQYYDLDNPDSKTYGSTRSEDEKRITDLITYLKHLLDTNAIIDLPKETVKQWFFDNVTDKLGFYDMKNKNIKLIRDKLAVQAKARLSQRVVVQKEENQPEFFVNLYESVRNVNATIGNQRNPNKYKIECVFCI